MLDSYVDRHEDRVNGDHVYIAYYNADAVAVRRTGELVWCSLSSLRALPQAQMHFVLIASMVAMYLSKDSARSSDMRDSTEHIANAGGSLTRSLLPVLRVWRTIYGLRSA